MNPADETRLKELIKEAQTEAIRAYVANGNDRLKQVVRLLNEAAGLLSEPVDFSALAEAEVVWIENE